MPCSTAIWGYAERGLRTAGFVACMLWASVGFTQTWTSLAAPTDLLPEEAMLLADGTVMVQNFPGNGWWRLTPDDNGSYINGTWSRLASLPSNYAPDYFASAVLADGRVVIIGGEHNYAVDNGGGDGLNSSLGAIYDPVSNAWAPLQPPNGWTRLGDAPGVVLANGLFLVGNGVLNDLPPELLDPATLAWTPTGSLEFGASGIYGAPVSEQGYTLLPGGQVLTIDIADPTYNSQVYDPGTGTWSSVGSTIVPLYVAQGTGCYEIGPAVLRPDGTVFAIGASSNTAIYDVAHKQWSPGPTFPAGLGVGDGPAALLPNGNVLVQASPCNQPGSQFFEFDGTRLNLVPSPAGDPQDEPSFIGRMLVLPTGQIFYTGIGSLAQIYTPSGSYQPAWAPTISNAPATISAGGTNYSISGTQFNGLSQGAMYGDDAQMATNYPLVRIINNATGHVSYARTHDHSSMGVATGSAIVSTKFDVPINIEGGASKLFVVANGIPSEPVNVDVAANTTSTNMVSLALGTTQQPAAKVSRSWCIRMR